MIVTVTMNPAIDKTIEVGCLNRGSLNRIKRVSYDTGGKGINVSRTIKALGGESLATGFLAGNNGKTIAEALSRLGIDNDFVWAEGETRTNTKVVEDSGILTELNEKGTFIPNEKTEELLNKIESLAKKGVLFVLSGSVPEGVDKDIYGRIIEMAHNKGAAVLTDADGELLKNAVSAVPDILKPNRAELEEYAGLHNASEKELMAAAKGLVDRGIKTVALSLGEKGAMFLIKGRAIRCPAIDIKVGSAVGAGDAMAAALAYSYEKGLSPEDTVRMCMAASAGAASTRGTKPPDIMLVHELMEKTELFDM